MKAALSVTLIQSEIIWENIEANLASLEESIWQIENPTDIILLPEMFTTGFTMNASDLAELPGGKTSRWMHQMAEQTNACILGSYIVFENKAYYNRLVVMFPDGNSLSYDKRHLFSMAGEDKVYSAGKKDLVFELNGWKIMPLICYDLRFPEWSRNKVDKNYQYKFDVQFYLANWPSARINAWDTLMRARAMENSAYVAGVNRVGKDENGIIYDGHSNAYNWKDEALIDDFNGPFQKTVKFSMNELIIYRKKFPALEDADNFEIIL